MNLVRPIAADELVAFLSLEPDPQRAADEAAYVDRMIRAGAMRREWCYLATDGDAVLGRFAFWSLPSIGTPISLVLLDVSAGVTPLGERAAIASTLLGRAVNDAIAGSPPEFGYVLDEPEQSPQWQGRPEERVAWLEAAGFLVVRSTSRWSFGGPAPSPGTRLTYRAYEEVGQAGFLAALELVSTDTLDERIEANRRRLGAAGEARETLQDLLALEATPGWWQLAYDAQGDLVGLVMPARTPSMTTIGYVGVVPAKRGQGYIDDLLAQGTWLLRRDVPELEVRADTDLANAPMAAAFERAGYSRFATRREFELPLESSRPPQESASKAAG